MLLIRAFLDWSGWTMSEYMEMPMQTVTEWWSAWEAAMEHAAKTQPPK